MTAGWDHGLWHPSSYNRPADSRRRRGVDAPEAAVDGEARATDDRRLRGRRPRPRTPRFEEVAHLLLHGRLPDAAERARLRAGSRAAARAAGHRPRGPARAPPPWRRRRWTRSRWRRSLLSLGREDDPHDDALTAIAAFATIVGSYWPVSQRRSGGADSHRSRRTRPTISIS